MPDTLCRRCGEELTEQSKCAECRQTIQHTCPDCKYTPLEKVHLYCRLISGPTYTPDKIVQEVIAA